MSKILTVFGATGNQGGSVIRAVLADPVLSKEFKIRGITRDTSKPAAKALADKGVEMVSADMSSAESAAPAVKGAHSVFLVTNFWESMSKDTEVSQGKAVTDAAKAAGVKHIVFSSLLNTTEISNGRLPNITHFVGKSEIEEYIRQSGLGGTFFLPGMFMSGVLDMLKKQEDGSYQFTLPEGMGADEAKLPLFDAAGDSGMFVAAALRNFPDGGGKRLYAATDYYTPTRVVSEFAEVTGQKAKTATVPQDLFKSFLPPPAAQELLENFLLTVNPGYYGGHDLAETKTLLGANDTPTTWKDYVKAHFKA